MQGIDPSEHKLPTNEEAEVIIKGNKNVKDLEFKAVPVKRSLDEIETDNNAESIKTEKAETVFKVKRSGGDPLENIERIGEVAEKETNLFAEIQDKIDHHNKTLVRAYFRFYCHWSSNVQTI